MKPIPYSRILKGMILFIVVSLGFCMPAKAQYILKQADTEYNLFNYAKAIDLYQKGYQKKKTTYAARQIASCYFLMQNYEEAETWYSTVIAMPGKIPEDLWNYARALQYNGKYEKARDTYTQYISINKQVKADQKERWLGSCDSALFWIKKPHSVKIKNLQILNSPQSEWGATVYQSGIVFASDRKEDQKAGTASTKSHSFIWFDHGKMPDKQVYGWLGNPYLRLYEQKDSLSEAVRFPFDANTTYHISPASFTADGKEVYFALTRMPDKPKYNKNKISTVCIEIYSSKKDSSGKWGKPVAFKYNKVNAYSVGDPYISRAGDTLYFVSNMPGGKGGTDIYYCIKSANGQWGAPVNLSTINTDGNERTPFFDHSNILYFSSTGYIGMGGLDIFKSAFKDGQFTVPVNLGYPINSSRDDYACSLTDSLSGYFASDRPGGKGSDDIYRFNFPKPVLPAPKPSFELRGVAYDKTTQQPLYDATIFLERPDGKSTTIKTNSSGKYQYDLDPDQDYNLKGQKRGFLGDRASLTTNGLKVTTIITRDLFLEKIDLNKEFILQNIYYDFNKANIRPDAALELDKLVKILMENPTISIELRSHTDSRGNDHYNMVLSQRRANSAVKYLLSSGIAADRVRAKGFGETHLLNGCGNGVKCTEAEHQLNRRTTFIILKY